MINLPENKKIILFDGVCNLCDASVQFIIKHDKNDAFRFVAIQSELGQNIIKYLGIDTSKTDSIILYEPGIAYYFKAEAALNIAKEIHGISVYIFITVLGIHVLASLLHHYIFKDKTLKRMWYGDSN